MRGDSRLSWGSIFFGIIIVGGAVFYWHMTHPFDQAPEAAPVAEGPAMEASEVFTTYNAPGSAPIVSNITPSVPADGTVPATEPAVNADGTPAAPSQAYDIPIVINYNDLSQEKAQWPRKIRLRADTVFPATIDGQTHGEVNAPAGAEVYLIKVNAEKTLLVGFGAAEMTLPAEATNFEEIVYQRLKAARHK